MKILHIITGLSTGGAERMLVKLVKSTSEYVEHSVIALSDNGAQGKILEDYGIPVFPLAMKASLTSLGAFLKLRNLIKRISPALIQGWMYHGNFAAILGSYLYKRTHVIFNIRHSLNNIDHEKKSTKLAIKSNSVLSRRASHIIYNSGTSRKQHESYGFASNNSVTIPNGFDIEKFISNGSFRTETRKELQISNDTILFGLVGRSHPVKNHIMFINAAKHLLKKQDNCHFLLVGRGVDENQNLIKQINALDIKRYVTLLGQRTDMVKIWNAVDFGVNSSKSEAFPNVVGEAMACETPCVVTDVGDSAYIVGDTGRVVEPNNPVMLATEMQRLHNLNIKARKNLGKKARKRIIENFSLGKIINQYINLYNKTIKN